MRASTRTSVRNTTKDIARSTLFQKRSFDSVSISAAFRSDEWGERRYTGNQRIATKGGHMAARILVLYNHPAEPAAFDAYYAHTHAPLTKVIPGLRSFQISNGPIAAGDGAESPYHLIAALD